jgi:hypothetical protein
MRVGLYDSTDDVENRFGGCSLLIYLGAFLEPHNGRDNGQPGTLLVAE